MTDIFVHTFLLIINVTYCPGNVASCAQTPSKSKAGRGTGRLHGRNVIIGRDRNGDGSRIHRIEWDGDVGNAGKMADRDCGFDMLICIVCRWYIIFWVGLGSGLSHTEKCDEQDVYELLHLITIFSE